MSNDFDQLAEAYQESDLKPDKRYSILPTVLQIGGDVRGKTVLDLGCGSGFFTEAFAGKGAQVIGVDRSTEQLGLTQTIFPDFVEYRFGDIFRDPLPNADVINAPFVLNYLPNVEALRTFICKLFSCLNIGGVLIVVCDIPSRLSDTKRFGAYKTIDQDVDGSPLTVELYNEERLLCTLHSTYFTIDTIQQTLREAGFVHVTRHTPIISSEGMKKFGGAFWASYPNGCDLMYVTARK